MVINNVKIKITGIISIIIVVILSLSVSLPGNDLSLAGSGLQSRSQADTALQ